MAELINCKVLLFFIRYLGHVVHGLFKKFGRKVNTIIIMERKFYEQLNALIYVVNSFKSVSNSHPEYLIPDKRKIQMHVEST